MPQGAGGSGGLSRGHPPGAVPSPVLQLPAETPGTVTFRACSAHRTNRSGLKLSVGSNSDFPRLADLINSYALFREVASVRTTVEEGW